VRLGCVIALFAAACSTTPIAARPVREPSRPERAAWIGFADLPSLGGRPLAAVAFHPEQPLLFVRGERSISVLDLNEGIVRSESVRGYGFGAERPDEPFTIGAGRLVPYADWASGHGWWAAIWDIERSRQVTRARDASAESLPEGAVTPDGSLALFFDGDARLFAIEPETGRVLFDLATPRGDLRAIEFGADIAYVWFAEDYIPPRRVTTLIAIALDDGRELGRVERAEWRPTFVLDEAHGIVAIAWPGELALHAAHDLRLLHSIPIAGYHVVGLGEGEILSASDDGIRRFEPETAEERAPIRAGQRADAVFGVGGHVYFQARSDGFFRVDALGSAVPVAPGTAFALSRDGSRIAMVSSERATREDRVTIADAHTGERRRVYSATGENMPMRGLTVAPDERAIALYFDAGVVVLEPDGVRAHSGVPPESEPFGAEERGALIHGDRIDELGDLLAVARAAPFALDACARERGVCVWDTRTLAIRARLAGTASEAVFWDDFGDSHLAAMSPDGARAVLVRGREWRLFDARSGSLIARRMLAYEPYDIDLFSDEIALLTHRDGDGEDDDVSTVVRIDGWEVLLEVAGDVYPTLSGGYALFMADGVLHTIDVASGVRTEIPGVRFLVGPSGDGTAVRVRAPGGIERDLALPRGELLAERVVDPNAWLTEPERSLCGDCAFRVDGDAIVRASDGARFIVRARAVRGGTLVALVIDEHGRFWAPEDHLSSIAIRDAGPFATARVRRVDATHPQYAPDLLRAVLVPADGGAREHVR
jgi:hypothetical protein